MNSKDLSSYTLNAHYFVFDSKLFGELYLHISYIGQFAIFSSYVLTKIQSSDLKQTKLKFLFNTYQQVLLSRCQMSMYNLLLNYTLTIILHCLLEYLGTWQEPYTVPTT